MIKLPDKAPNSSCSRLMFSRTDPKGISHKENLVPKGVSSCGGYFGFVKCRDTRYRLMSVGPMRPMSTHLIPNCVLLRRLIYAPSIYLILCCHRRQANHQLAVSRSLQPNPPNRSISLLDDLAAGFLEWVRSYRLKCSRELKIRPLL